MPVDRPALRRWLLPSLLLAAVLPAWAASARAGDLADFGVQQPHRSVPAPDVTLPRLDGGTLSLSKLRGRLVILHFWATWCVSCRQEMPRIEALQQHYGERLAVLGINVDRGNRPGVARFVRAHGIGFPTVLDAAGSVRRRYRIRALPTSYLIGRDGTIIGRIIGARDWGSPSARNLVDRLVVGTGPNPGAAAGASRRCNGP